MYIYIYTYYNSSISLYTLCNPQYITKIGDDRCCLILDVLR